MVKLKVVKKYEDIELERRLTVGEEIEVTLDRAMKLLGLGLVEVLEIDNFSKKKNAKASSVKEG